MKKKDLEGKIIETLMPFLVFGISIAVVISLIVLFFYLFMWGVIIGFVLWAIMTLKEKFFSSKEKDIFHKVLHVEEDGSVVVEGESIHSSEQSQKRTRRRKS